MIVNCSACLNKMTYVCKANIRDFDGSIFNLTENIFVCAACGLCSVQNGLSDNIIAEHYANSSMYIALSGVGVGGNTAEDLMRYAYYNRFMRSQGCVDFGSLADIGCSRGGFLKYLSEQQPGLFLTGVDCDLGSLNLLEQSKIPALLGDILMLPLEDNMWDTLCYFHVLEHIYNIDGVLHEAFRALKSGGSLLIEVPDAENYGNPECYVGAMFWAGMKEHVNHFSLNSLVRFCEKNGFGVVAVSRSFQPMKAAQAYPSLLIRAIKEGQTVVDSNSESCRIKDFFYSEFNSARVIAFYLSKAFKKHKKITFWGMGLEFFALYPFLINSLVGKNIQLIDSNPAKVGKKVDGILVHCPDFFGAEGLLVCCSYMSNCEIIKAATCKGWLKKQLIDIAQIGLLPAI